MLKWIWYIPRRACQALIVLYQYTISPDHSWMSRFYAYRVCRFNPTCSEFGFEAIGKHGVIKGIPMTAWRILRCNPWSKGGHDPVPEKMKNT